MPSRRHQGLDRWDLAEPCGVFYSSYRAGLVVYEPGMGLGPFPSCGPPAPAVPALLPQHPAGC